MLSELTATTFDDLVSAVIRPTMKTFGFRKSGLRWTREARDVQHTVWIQRYPRPRGADWIAFTINFRSSCPEVAVDGRIGALLDDDPHDIWWRITGNTVDHYFGPSPPMTRSEVRDEIALLVTRTCNALERLDSADAIRAFADESARTPTALVIPRYSARP